MEIEKDVVQPAREAGHIVQKSVWSVVRDPQILLYPVLALIVSFLINSILSKTVLSDWYDKVFNELNTTVPNRAHYVLGVVTLSAFVAAVVSAYFNCAVSASILAKLDGQPTRPLFGLIEVFRHFIRVSAFALLAVFMFPVGIIVQWRKLPWKIIEVFGQALALNMAIIAPEVLHTRKSFALTIVDAFEILGRKWKAALIVKIGLYSAVVLVVVLPKLIQNGFFSSPSADKVGWAISLVIGVSSLTFFKVINGIFTSVLYHQAKSQK